MMYPIVFKRKRVGTIVMNSLLLVFSAVMLIYGVLADKSISLYVIAVIVFGGSLAFNIFLSCEKTFVIDEEKMYSCSIFIPKFSVKRENIKSVRIAEEDETKLFVYYDLPEFNLKTNLGDFIGKDPLVEAPWSFVISKSDVDKPLNEVKFIIEDVIITEKAKLNSRDNYDDLILE